MSTVQSHLWRVLRIVAIVLLAGIGVVLFFFPEPFTSALGIVLIVVAFFWAGWGVFRNRSNTD